MVKGCIANIGIPLEIFRCYVISMIFSYFFQIFGLSGELPGGESVAVAVGVSDM